MGGGVPIQASLLFNVLGVLVRALFAQFREAAAAVLFYSFLIFSFLTPSITLFSFFFLRGAYLLYLNQQLCCEVHCGLHLHMGVRTLNGHSDLDGAGTE